MHEDTWIVSMCALRYAIGRRTYVTEVVSSFIIDHLEYFHKIELDKIVEEVEEALATQDCGDQCDIINWIALASKARLELEKREKV